ncbi:hypothetical protein C1H46_036461 [Malus baccata]|uniref:Methionine aminopeptidase n=1 Tax=Malus baccata TaxID=106549 RepID=A0A540KV57_MALBA|nr:hypothetical protein C1H46_036461 [Malus baccata]
MAVAGGLQLSAPSHGGQGHVLLSSTKSTIFAGAPLSFSFSTSGKESFSRKNLVVFARKLSGLEEAMRIKRERESRQLAPKVGRRPPLRRGRVSPQLPVPDHIPRPPYVGSSLLPEIASDRQVPGSEGIDDMRAACELAARVLESAGKLVKPSITTNEIDKAVHQMIIDAGAYPSPLGYGGFPKSVCTSVNECMCHGIPDSRQLQSGDIVNIDVTVYLNEQKSYREKMAVAGGLQLSAPSHGGQGHVLLSSTKSTIFAGAPLSFSFSTSGPVSLLFLCECSSKRIVFSEKPRCVCSDAVGVGGGHENQKPSITTNEIDKAVHQMIIDAGAYPSPLGYGGFPKSVCTSVNECMCHGIPDSRQLQSGDIVNIDVTVYLNGYHGDTSKTFLCGDVSERIQRLVKVTEECLEKGIAVCKDGASFKKIGKRISEHAEKYGYGVVERFVGHGVGTVFHSEPLILHHCNDQSGSMVEGQTFTIEPILTMGSIDCKTWPDNWTTLTADGSPAAQFEHTILITRTGAEILTTC